MNIHIGMSLPIERTEDDDLFGRSGDSNTRLVINRSHDLDTGRTSTRIGLATRRSCRASDCSSRRRVGELIETHSRTKMNHYIR
jgi:hypothetical protein